MLMMLFTVYYVHVLYTAHVHVYNLYIHRCAHVQYFPDRKLRKEIRSLSLTCPIDGCFWKGVLNDYEVRIMNVSLDKAF